MSNEVLKPQEAAEYLRINREVLRRLSEQGKIQGAYKVGNQWRYVKVELLKKGESKSDEISQ
jgi:excisionase family DNA binding protein